MANDRVLPLLIIAQSARFLAQAASFSGFRVWGADCFADVDACDVAERWHLLAPLDQLTTEQLLEAIVTLSQGEPCQLIYGGGIEHYPALFDQLPDHIQLMGNSPPTLQTINHPATFFALLAELELPFPELSWQRPAQQTAWLFKPHTSLGGNGILPAHQAATAEQGYFQHQITGASLSALFLANGTDAQLIGINRQWTAPIPTTPFRLGGIESAYTLDAAITEQITHAINTLTLATGLIGLNSLDFIVSDEGKCYLLEINPRPSASAELYHTEYPLIQSHLTACHQQSLDQESESKQASFRSLSYLYATTQSVIIPSHFSWPFACRDIPTADSRIRPAQPICTLLISGHSQTHCHQQRQQLEAEITSQLKLNALV